MMNEDQALSLAEEARRGAPADQVEAMVWAEDLSLTRLAESFIHQNVAESNVRVTVRAVIGQQTGCATTNRTEPEELRATAEKAARLARNSAPNPHFKSLPSPAPIAPVDAFAPATAASTPEARAAAAKEIIAAATRIGAIASGSLSVSCGQFAVANSLGIRAAQPWSRAQLVVIVADGEASGYGEWQGKDLALLPVQEVAEVAAAKCALSRNIQPIAPGQYTVVLEEPAVADLVQFLAWLGLGATSFQEGRSFMCDQIGRQIAGEQITLWDDGHDPRLFPLAFDYEGVPKQKLVLIEKGIARGLAYDSYTAGKEGKQSTGHALPATSTYGPFPLHLCLAPGDKSREELISSTERGLLVSRFHYTNVISPRETIITGMTRDGTYLIENGRIVRPVQNLRFTQNILAALRKTESLTREVKLSMDCLAPALKTTEFTFTS